MRGAVGGLRFEAKEKKLRRLQGKKLRRLENKKVRMWETEKVSDLSNSDFLIFLPSIF